MSSSIDHWGSHRRVQHEAVSTDCVAILNAHEMSRDRRSRRWNVSCTAYLTPSSEVCFCANTRNCTHKQRSLRSNVMRMNRGEHCSTIFLVCLVALNWFVILRHTSRPCPHSCVKTYLRKTSFQGSMNWFALLKHMRMHCPH